MEAPLKSENKSLLPAPTRQSSNGGDSTHSTDKKRSSGGTADESNPEAQAELATAIDELLETVGTKFTTMSKDIMTQMDIMAARLDELEAQARSAMAADTKKDSGGS